MIQKFVHKMRNVCLSLTARFNFAQTIKSIDYTKDNCQLGCDINEKIVYVMPLRLISKRICPWNKLLKQI